MSIERELLLMLRAVGPCSIAALSESRTLTWEQAYAGIFRLRDKNLACRIGDARYDITKRGRRVIDELFVKGKPTLWSEPASAAG